MRVVAWVRPLGSSADGDGAPPPLPRAFVPQHVHSEPCSLSHATFLGWLGSAHRRTLDLWLPAVEAEAQVLGSLSPSSASWSSSGRKT